MADQVVVTESLTQRMIDAGAKLVGALDANEMNVSAAFWFYMESSDAWRLMIAVSEAQLEGPKRVYEKLQGILNRSQGNDQIALGDISIVAPNDSLVSLLRVAVKTDSKSVSGIRFSRNTVNGQFIRDAYIYRLN